MLDSLSNLMGDYARTSPVLLPSEIAVDVLRRGERVLLCIGNADPISLTWKEGIRVGMKLLSESKIAARRREQVELGFGHHTLTMPATAARRIGHRLRDRAFEVKFLVNGVSGAVGPTRGFSCD